MTYPVIPWEEALALLKSIQDALGTDETGENLVAVASDAHRAEQELAALRSRTRSDPNKLQKGLKNSNFPLAKTS